MVFGLIIFLLLISCLFTDKEKKKQKEWKKDYERIMGGSMKNKRCANCGKYPFCNNCECPIGRCDDWVERK